MTYRQDIDGLRALAVAVIVLFHFGVSALSGGYVGVDVFFVISGFLITKLILEDVAKHRFSFRAFYMRRVRRLGPSLIATLALTMVGGWFILSPVHLEELGLAVQATVISLSNFLFWTQAGYFDTEAIYKPLLHTWSLGVEEQFYFVWPATLLLLCRFTTTKGSLFVLICLSLASLVAAEVMIDRDPAGAFFLPIYRVYEFAFGAVLAMTGRLARPGLAADLSSVAGIGLIALAALAFSEDQRFPGLSALIPCLGAALLIFAGPQAAANRVLSIGAIRYIGLISYSLYLVHWPILVYFAYSYGPPDSLGETALLIVLAVALGALFYHFIETPFRRKGASGFRVPGKVLGSSVLACAVIIMLIGGEFDSNKGFPSRLPPDMQSFLDRLDEAKKGRREAIRRDICHVSGKTDLAPEAFAPRCLPENPRDAIVVLGDSHAADIWAALSAAYPERVFVQFTGGGCDLGRERSEEYRCRILADLAKSWVSENADRVEAIIYSQRAAFAMKGGEDSDTRLRPDADILAALRGELDDFATLGIPLYFWGPRPEFHPELEVVAMTSKTMEALRAHYDAADYGRYARLDAMLAEVFSDSPVTYLSSLEPLCDPACPILDKDDGPVIVDYGHWSPDGGRLAVERVISGTDALSRLLR